MSSPSTSSNLSPQLKRKRQADSTHSDSEPSSSESEQDVDDTPETVSALSHAERRRQKKRGNQSGKEDKPSEAKKRKVTAGAAKRQNSVWVGNLCFKTTLEALKGFFDGVGEITRVHMPMKATAPNAKPENRGFAYVDFTTPEAKAAAIAKSEQPLVGRRLLIKDGDDFAGRPGTEGHENNTSDSSKPRLSKTAQKILRSQKQPPAPTLFFGNLGFEATEKSIRELLDAHRTVNRKPKGDAEPGQQQQQDKSQEPKAADKWIRKVRLGAFEDSGLCKGFAFVDFTSIEHATSALINPRNHQLDGRKLVVEYASADAVRRGGGGPKPAKDDRGAGARRGGPANRGSGVGRPQPRRVRAEDPREPTVVSEEGGKTEGAPRHPERLDPEEVPPAYRSRSGREKGPRVRPKPGAALALAKRESAAIVPSKGQKITF